MKKIVRHAAFEANSSSSHSISLSESSKEFVFDSIYPDENGVISLHGGPWGWKWFCHNDAATKANYAAQQFENSPSDLKTLISVIEKQTGAKKVLIDASSGQVDHQSMGIVLNDPDWLKDFIFNKNSWLFGGNDNNPPSKKDYQKPTFFADGRVEPFKYTYEIGVEDFDIKMRVGGELSPSKIEEEILDLPSRFYFNDQVYVASRLQDKIEQGFISLEKATVHSEAEDIFKNDHVELLDSNGLMLKSNFIRPWRDVDSITQQLFTIPGYRIFKKLIFTKL